MLVFLAFRGRVRDLKVKIIPGCVEQPFRRQCPLSSGHVFLFESSRKTRWLESRRCRLKACSTIALRTGTQIATACPETGITITFMSRTRLYIAANSRLEYSK